MRAFLIILFTSLVAACKETSRSSVSLEKQAPEKAINKNKTARDSSLLEKRFVRYGLVNIEQFDTNIRVVLMYNTASNFLQKPFYNGLNKCYLPYEVALKLSKAQALLKESYPFYNLVVFDATRPLSIQKMMWDSLKLEPNVKFNYLAYPGDLSLHNYGAAVDIGIIGSNNLLLDMGTPYDFFGELAQPRFEQKFLSTGRLTQAAYNNRLILRDVMKKAGFISIPTEWWHFNSCDKAYAATYYKLID